MESVAGAMKNVLLLILLLPMVGQAQDAERFARACEHRGPGALDRWMKHELHERRKGTRISNPGSSYVTHTATYDSLVSWLVKQPGVRGAAWDKCMIKTLGWPGRSTVGLSIVTEYLMVERCYDVQEGRRGTIQLFGWRPGVRKSREELKFLGVRECPRFVEEQRKACMDIAR